MLTIEYYTDVLCVWAWIAQRRLEELHAQFGADIQVKHRYMDVFGDVPGKMQLQWQERGGYEGFAEHVQKSASNYENAPVHADIWSRVRPNTSANAHLYIKAVELAADDSAAAEFARHLREAFFLHAVDIGTHPALDALVSDKGLELSKVHSVIASGEAMASLLADYRSAHSRNLKGSPSYIMNNERQTLYGNVGYRVLSANVEELLKSVEHEASWC